MNATVPSQEVLQAAIKEAAACCSTGYVSVVDVYQVLPQFEAPRRYHLVVEEAIKAVYPEAQDIGGGVFELGDPDAAQKSQVEEDAEAEEDEAEALFGEADLEWTASNGQRVRVWAGNFQGQFHVAVDSKLWTGKSFQPVPAKFAAQAQKNGVIAMLGPVGLNAERKLACQRIPRHGVNQPVG